jgi:hypothetical protein
MWRPKPESSISTSLPPPRWSFGTPFSQDDCEHLQVERPVQDARCAHWILDACEASRI